MTPNTITVLIEGDDTEKEAKLRKFSLEYGAGLYETEDGREFYVEPALIQESNDEHKAVPIPLQVITHREAMLQKLKWGQEQLERLNKEDQSGIILPDAYKA
jgi:hypothetical protein